MKRILTVTSKCKILALLFVFVCLFITTGCPSKTIVMKPSEQGQEAKPAEPVKPKKPTQVDGGETTQPTTPKDFYELGEYARAERMAGAMVTSPNLPAAQRSEAWQYYVLSAAANNHLHLAQQALNNWAEQEPGIENSIAWQDAWLDTTSRFPAFEAREKANASLNSGASGSMQARIYAVLALCASGQEEMGPALERMNELYGNMSNSDRAGLEKVFARQLTRQEPSVLGSLYANINGSNASKFPYTIINLEQGRRMMFGSDPNQKGAGRQIVQSLVDSGVLADPSLASSLVDAAAAQESAFQTLPGDVPSQGNVALLLPMQGQFAGLSNKIYNGAQAAQHAMARAGSGVNITLIDTESPDWQQKLAALPANVVIGGPMTSAAYEQAKTGGLLTGRAVFAFLPALPSGEEGVVAWRFFTSPKDQVDALLGFCRDDLGIYGVGSLFPTDSYGERMNGVMQAEAANYGISVTSSPYSTQNMSEWDGAVKSLLRNKGAFDAVFMPDTWANAKGIVSYIFYNREDRLVLMGTALWEQSLYNERTPDASYFYLGVFPGAWNNESQSPAKQTLVSILNQMGAGAAGAIPGQAASSGGADFWQALGFDFVRFAMNLGEPSSGILESGAWSAEELNSRITTAQSMDWSMAPMQWSSDGLVAQKLFLFTPTEDGFAPVRVEEFKQRIAQTKAKHAVRWSNTGK